MLYISIGKIEQHTNSKKNNEIKTFALSYAYSINNVNLLGSVLNVNYVFKPV